MRPSGRAPDQMRAITIEPRFTRHAEGSVLIGFGDTKVLVTASIEERVPPFLRGKGEGWVTAEYGMLPRATTERTRREASAGKQTGRTQEIQRLIGRSLRAVTDLPGLGEKQIIVDCDVLQADGGTRTASITGAWIALHDAIIGAQVRVIELHVSNVFARESFRHHSYISPVAAGVIVGLGVAGYPIALRALAERT